MSYRRFVDENWANHECVQHSNLAKDDISCERRHFCKNHELSYHLLLNFSYVRISFQTNVDLNLQNSYVDFRLYRARFDLDRDCHVKLLWIFDEENQLVLNRNEQELVSNRSSFAELVYSFQTSAVFIRAFVVNQDVHIVCVSQRFRIDFESIVHLQQIDIVKQIKNEKQREFLKSFCSHRERSDHSAIHRQNRRCDSEENWSLSRLFTSIFFFFADHELIAHVKSYRMFRSHRDSIKWQFDSCSCLIRCISASWKISMSTRLIDFYDISCESRVIIDTSSSVMRFVCSWSISWSCSWCSEKLWIDTSLKWCNHLFWFFSKWSCWLLWTSSNDKTIECMSRTEMWAVWSWWERMLWAICWWNRQNSKSYRRRIAWWS